MKSYFVDTSAIVAFQNRNDDNYQNALKIFTELANRKCMLFITDYIQMETHGLLLSRAGRTIAQKFLEDDSWNIETVTTIDKVKAIALLKRYQDKDFSLTDATSFIVMERLGLTTAITFDDHFKQYGFMVNLI